MQTTKELERSARRETSIKNAFSKWLSEPITRMGISMIPAGEEDDTLRLLLESSFNAGAEAGSGVTAGEFADAMFDAMLKDKPQRDQR